MTNIWDTVEVSAWCRGFNYQEYSELHSKYGVGNRLDEQAYEELGNVFEKAMDRSMSYVNEHDPIWE